jgi:hypothetical protein
VNYQPIFGTDEPSQRRCDDRYAPIRELASKFKRPFSVLDVGANFGWFSFKLMSEFDCCAVMVDDKPIGDLIQKHAPDRSVWLNTHLTGHELRRLSKSEHFDIVLGLSVLHHIEDYKEAFEGLTKLGSYVFIELPAYGEKTAANPERHNAIHWMLADYEPIAHFQSHLANLKRPMYLIESEPTLREQTMDARERDAPDYGKYVIASDFENSTVLITREGRPHLSECRYFIPGMNAHNFLTLGGGYPTEKHIRGQMVPEHPDNHLWNYVLGFGVHPIDTVRKW